MTSAAGRQVRYYGDGSGRDSFIHLAPENTHGRAHAHSSRYYNEESIPPRARKAVVTVPNSFLVQSMKRQQEGIAEPPQRSTLLQTKATPETSSFSDTRGYVTGYAGHVPGKQFVHGTNSFDGPRSPSPSSKKSFRRSRSPTKSGGSPSSTLQGDDVLKSKPPAWR